MPVNALYRDDFYLSTCPALVIAVHGDGSIELDQTCFYAASGGQPGDRGIFERADGSHITIVDTRHGQTKDTILHIPSEDAALPEVGESITLQLDWQRRHKLMRMHTACHLLSVVCPYPITGASVGEDESRIDFDMSETIHKDNVTEKLMALVRDNHPVYVNWITDEELVANPELVKSKNVRPPIGFGRVSLVCIGDQASIDSQPCGGTHVLKTGEIGSIQISKIEKKGKENRRFRIRIEEAIQEDHVLNQSDDPQKSRFVVSADWVEQRLGTPGFRVVDASFYLPAQKRNADDEYAAGHIPGAVRFDQDHIADHSAPLPHTVPSPEIFATEVGKLGISESDTIVIYDGPGIFAAPRVWWLFRIMGAKNVFVLDGGLDGWKREKHPLETVRRSPEPVTFQPTFDETQVVSFDTMRDIVSSGAMEIADARSTGRFEGREAEPRQGMRSGHMPGARNLPSSIFSDNGKFKSLDELRTLFQEARIDLSRPVVTSCGSGITAAIITLALESIGHSDNRLYDGSWSEWGGRDDTPIVTGPAGEA